MTETSKDQWKIKRKPVHMKAKYKELRLLHRTEQTEKKREKPEYTDLSSYSIISCSETILQPDDLWDRFLESQSPEQD